VSETEDEQDNVPIHTNLRLKGIKLLSERESDEVARHGEVLRWSSDSEADEVPIAQTTVQKTKQSDIWGPTAKTKALLADLDKNGTEDFPVMQAIPEGHEAVGVGIARDFGKDMGVFKGEVRHVKAQRKRHIYHVQYEDGDSENFGLAEYQFAYEVRQAVDAGKFRREDSGTENNDNISNDGTEDEWNVTENVSDSDNDITANGKRSRLKSKMLKTMAIYLRNDNARRKKGTRPKRSDCLKLRNSWTSKRTRWILFC
jgi:hypothetical protein